MIITYSQMHCTDKYSQHSSIIWPVRLNGWVFVYKLTGCGFESCCYHLNHRHCAYFEQGLPWHSRSSLMLLHRYFFTVMVKRSTLQLYRTIIFLAQLWMAASTHLINKCYQKIRQVKNQIIKHQIRRKIKATRLLKFLFCFFKWLERVLLGELQVPNALQHRFKIFSGTT